MPPRTKRPATKRTPSAIGEGSSRSSLDPRFPDASFQDRFHKHKFQIIPSRSIDPVFFRDFCFHVIQIIQYYMLDSFVFCEHDINLTLLSEFYNNLHKVGGDHHYRTRVAHRNLDFTPTIWEDFLGCRKSSNTFVFYPTLIEPLIPPFDTITLEAMHQGFYQRPRPLNVNLFSSNALSVQDNVLYKVIVNSLLPIVTRGMALVRPPHLFLMHALRHSLDINIALNTFHCITHFIHPVSGKIHMPFGAILTQWLASVGIDISRGTLKTVSATYDRITTRTLSLAGMKVTGGSLVWKDGRQVGEGARRPARAHSPAVQEEPAIGDPEAPEAAESEPESEDSFEMYVSGQLEYLTITVEDLQTEVRSWMSSMDRRHEELVHLVRSSIPGQASSSAAPAADDMDDEP